ncbi:MAG: diaminopimelate epimerase, partial [Dehalococcoidia bacterium]|nr:diaminopimelate epimerase [Dehalococcoidia bacterium]
MKFTKMQGAGNDFVVVKPESSRRDWSKLAMAMCDRHFGIGADGLLLLLPSKMADFKMRIFNADGSESKACGNGMRCLVKYYLDEHPSGKDDFEVSIETAAGNRRAKVHRRRGEVTEIQASMGKPRVGHNGTPAIFDTKTGTSVDITKTLNRTIKVNGQELLLSLVSIGNPHAVHFTRASIRDYPLSLIGPAVEQHRLFLDETNYEVAHIISKQVVEARVWERGCGETLACGSGACAITVAGRLLGYLDRKVDVRLPGGTLGVEWDGKGEVFLSGPAVTVYNGEW